MKKETRIRGFTLIEMLVVIAVIAVLVAMVVPVVSNVTVKAKAATDAANLRTVLGEANVLLTDQAVEPSAVIAGLKPIACKTIPGAEAYIGYLEPGFIAPFFVSDGQYYPLEYFADIAEHGATTIETAQPSGYTMYRVGGNGGN